MRGYWFDNNVGTFKFHRKYMGVPTKPVVRKYRSIVNSRYKAGYKRPVTGNVSIVNAFYKIPVNRPLTGNASIVNSAYKIPVNRPLIGKVSIVSSSYESEGFLNANR